MSLNALIATGGGFNPVFDYQKSQANALNIQGARDELSYRPEERNWLRKKRGWETQAKEQGLADQPVEKHIKLMDAALNEASMMDYSNYPQFYEFYSRAGVRPGALPPPQLFEQKAAETGGDPAKEFETWKTKFVPMGKKKLEELKLLIQQQGAVKMGKPGETPMLGGQPIGKPLPEGPQKITYKQTDEGNIVGLPESIRPGQEITPIETGLKGKTPEQETNEWKTFKAEGERQGKTTEGILKEWDQRVKNRTTQNVYIGNDVNGNPLFAPSKGTPKVITGEAPPGGIADKKLSEKFKEDQTAINQADDLIKQLETQWKALNITDRPSAVSAYMSGKIGRNKNAKVYADSVDAFLGNISRSLAAERGVLTDQDIKRVSKALAKIGWDPFSVDSKEEGEKKWKQIHDIIANSKKRLDQRSRMTQSNPTGANEKPLADPLGLR